MIAKTRSVSPRQTAVALHFVKLTDMVIALEAVAVAGDGTLQGKKSADLLVNVPRKPPGVIEVMTNVDPFWVVQICPRAN